MGLKSFRRPLALFALVVGIGLAAAFVYRPWEAGQPPAPILGVAHETQIRIAPETDGRLGSFQVSAGQTVRKGDILATLSNPELAAAVEEARANLATARADRANVDAGVRKEEVDTASQQIRIANPILPSRKSNTPDPLRSRPRPSPASRSLTREPRRSARPKPSSTRLKPLTRKTGPARLLRSARSRRRRSPMPRRRSRISKPSSPRPRSSLRSTAS